jgi:hypothetical protein
VAQIVGARTQRPAVTSSAPGVVLSRRKFNIELHDINNYPRQRTHPNFSRLVGAIE